MSCEMTSMAELPTGKAVILLEVCPFLYFMSASECLSLVACKIPLCIFQTDAKVQKMGTMSCFGYVTAYTLSLCFILHEDA